MRRLASFTVAAAMALAAAGLATSANATNFVGVDTINAYPYGGPNTEGGLGILISDPTDLNFNLTNVGDTTGYQTLFRIYTNETSWNFDDGNAQPITLSFNFSAPAPGSSGGFGGETDTASFLGFNTHGTLDWSGTGSTLLNFTSGYQVRVDLESLSESYNHGDGFLDLNPGIQNGADVRAKFTLLAVPTAVPEPATWGMMIMGFGLAGAVIRRRRSVAFA
jgi:hypothetical protein